MAIQQKINVMHAVILRDIRSRFFNHGLGFLIVPLFPVGHLLILLTAYDIIGRTNAFGDDLRTFFATGLVPALTFMYLSRYMSMSLVANKSMMAFPVVRLLDIVLARAVLELVGIILAAMIIFTILLALGSDPFPRDPSLALQAMFFIILGALGSGIMASVIASFAPMFTVVYALSMVVLYLSSGAPVYLHSFPEEIIYIASWNPAFHGVEWMRTAYYLGYPDQYLNKGYLIGYGLGSLALGLLMERTMRTLALTAQ